MKFCFSNIFRKMIRNFISRNEPNFEKNGLKILCLICCDRFILTSYINFLDFGSPGHQEQFTCTTYLRSNIQKYSMMHNTINNRMTQRNERIPVTKFKFKSIRIDCNTLSVNLFNFLHSGWIILTWSNGLFERWRFYYFQEVTFLMFFFLKNFQKI